MQRSLGLSLENYHLILICLLVQLFSLVHHPLADPIDSILILHSQDFCFLLSVRLVSALELSLSLLSKALVYL